jgi:glycogen(starch) synthase
MRILVLTNFFPPHELGGQGRSCQQVVESLKQRGHSILVLTSMHSSNGASRNTNGVDRHLYLEMDLLPWRHALVFFTNRKRREKHNLRCLEDSINRFDPDIVFIWGMWNLSQSLPAMAETKCASKVVYRFAEYWPTLPNQHVLYWQALGRKWHTRVLKRVLAPLALNLLAKEKQPPPLKYENAICVSAAIRDILIKDGIPVSNARIIHTGLNVDQYLKQDSLDHSRSNHRHLELLYAGRLSVEKGVDTIIKAMEILVHDRGFKNVRLSIAGAGSVSFEYYLHKLVKEASLQNYVSFLGRQPFEAMPHLYPQFDALLVPSIWPEPFARIVLEGMISGLVIIATPTGGTTEIVENGKNGLLFNPGDAEALSRKIIDLGADPELRQRLAGAGRKTVIENFNIDRMVDEIETFLLEVANLNQ